MFVPCHEGPPATKGHFSSEPAVAGRGRYYCTAFSYLGHIICDDLSDDADLKAKSRQMYAKSNTLRNKFHMCSTQVSSSSTPNSPFLG